MKTTTTETKPLVRQDPEPNRPTRTPDASDSQVPETSMHEDIAKLAYGLWQERGCPQGSADGEWLEAERNFRESAEHVSR
jgi:hypothetical protein